MPNHVHALGEAAARPFAQRYSALVEIVFAAHELNRALNREGDVWMDGELRSYRAGLGGVDGPCANILPLILKRASCATGRICLRGTAALVLEEEQMATGWKRPLDASGGTPELRASLATREELGFSDRQLAHSLGARREPKFGAIGSRAESSRPIAWSIPARRSSRPTRLITIPPTATRTSVARPANAKS